MELINAKIENFGKLHNINIDFNSGLNVYLRENGFGKSTLAAFIRVMFYGLSGDRKSQDGDNDRKKYRPWQGGAFGGELVFRLSNNRKYRIMRTFGERKGQDDFKLYDADTNLPSVDYTENIGEEILKIDERSFRRTVFIGQQELDTGVTSQINARIGNVSDDQDDINKYESVIAELKDEINALSPNRRTGEIFKKRMELEILKSRLKSKETLESELTQCAERLHTAGEDQRRMSRFMDAMNSRILALSQYQDVLKEKIAYENIIQDISNCERRLIDAQKRHFGADFETLTPEDRSSQLSRDLRALDKRFRNGIPDERDLRNVERCIAREQFLREKLSLMEQTGYDTGHRAGAGDDPTTRVLAVILALISILGGGYLIITNISFIIGLLVVAGGLTIAIIMFVTAAVKSSKRAARDRAHTRRPQGVLEVRNEISKLDRDIAHYFGRFYPEADLSDPEHIDFDAFRGLGNDVLKYNRLCDIREFAEELSIKRRDKAEFERTHDIDKLRNIMSPAEGDDTFEILSQKLKELTISFNRTNDLIHSLKMQVRTKEEELESAYAIEGQYNHGLEELHELEQRYNLLVITRDHLESAHNNFTKEYLSPLMSAFEKYYRIFINSSGLKEVPYRMDTHFNVHFIAEGQEHSTQLLSAVFQNLVELARRMAFIDAMYSDEKPFILLDDPFVNLDEDKVDGGIKFLDEIGKTYQVIYFTCHESRM